MTQAQELWAIKSPEGGYLLGGKPKTEGEAWLELHCRVYPYCSFIEPTIKEFLGKGYQAVRVRVEEIENGD